MSRHLSAEQISRWVTGEHGPPEEEHLRDCPDCRKKLTQLESVLSQFRSSAWHWSESQAVGERSLQVLKNQVGQVSNLLPISNRPAEVGRPSDGSFSFQSMAARRQSTPNTSYRPRRWALVAAMILILGTVPVYQNARGRKRAAEQAAADAILMERVERAVSRTVPRPMEPLTELVSWESSPKEGNERKQ